MNASYTPARRLSSVVMAVLFVCATLGGSIGNPTPADAAPLVHWGYYVTYAKDSYTALLANMGAYTMVSPYYFAIQKDGTIKSFDEPETNQILRQNRVKIVPMVKNDAHNAEFTPFINTPEAREKLASTIADLVVPRNYDGINVDIEDVVPADRPYLTDLMSRIAAKVRPSGKLITQAVVGKAQDSKGGYGGAFDYAALAPSVDYVLLMAYDYHYAGGDPGPVAPIDWVRDVAKFAASTFGAQKSLLGVPLYGYDWNITTGGTAKAITYNNALTRVQKPGAIRTLDPASQSEVVRYTDEDGNKHEAWFESAATFDAKLKVVKEVGIAGFGTWRIGQEDPGVYDVLRRGDTPAARVASTGDTTPSHTYFAETGHNLSNALKAFYDSNGGLARFGLPLTEEFTERNPADDKVYTVQYFERARMEYHSDTASVALGTLGTEIFNSRYPGNSPAAAPVAASGSPVAGTPGIAGSASVGTGTAGSLGSPANSPVSAAAATGDKRYFPETRHTLGSAFRQYWEATPNGLGIFGYPISEELTENGKTVQYFQRVRLELNAAATTPETKVQVGLLGSEVLRVRGWVQ